jgi:hypothetical protein
MLNEPEYRRDMERRMVEYGGHDAWPRVGERYIELFRRVVAGQSLDDLLAIVPQAVHQ